ncbi:MAG: DNA-3-methyladenine glycosylase, partial [Thermoplasmata archaeon]|nr:DNA-3-methyladenine glycosylase [Thermoplasmata archaeon]
PTPRNRSMFGSPGTLYVYRIHQSHCANVVTQRGEAVLLRAAEPLTKGLTSLSGPGRLCRGLGLSRSEDGESLTSSSVRLWGGGIPAERIVTGRRVGVRKAVSRRLRFALAGNPHVSRPRP